MSTKQKSRPQRWLDATLKAQSAIEEAKAAIADLVDLKSEYEDWLGNLPENLQSSALADKLQTVVDLDLDSADSSLDEASSIMCDAENAELPRGFGKD